MKANHRYKMKMKKVDKFIVMELYICIGAEIYGQKLPKIGSSPTSAQKLQETKQKLDKKRGTHVFPLTKVEKAEKGNRDDNFAAINRSYTIHLSIIIKLPKKSISMVHEIRTSALKT